MLNIGYNCLLDITASAIQIPIKNNKNLIRLGLQSTQITCKGAKNLAEALETNISLQVSFTHINFLFFHSFIVSTVVLNIRYINKTKII